MGAAQCEDTSISANAQNLAAAAAMVSADCLVDDAEAILSKITPDSMEILALAQSSTAELAISELMGYEVKSAELVQPKAVASPAKMAKHGYQKAEETFERQQSISVINADITKQRHLKRLNTVKLILIGVALTCITNFPSAFMHTSVNTAVDELNAYLKDSYIERGDPLKSDTHFALLRSVINSCWYAGQVIGALFSPFLTDKYGRKPAYLLSTVMMTFACAFQMISTLFPYPEFLIVGRVLASMFSPMSDTVAILYLQEISPPKLRGALSSLFATGYCAMGLLGMILGIRPVFGHSLTLLFSVPVIPGLISLLFLMWLPETPKFLLITKNSRKEALKSLNFFQGGMPSNKEEILDAYAQESKDEPVENATILSLLRVSHLRRALVLSFLVMIPTLSFYPILQNSTYFFQRINFEKSFSQYSSSFMMALLTICCVMAAFLLDRFQRRTLVLFFGTGSLLSLVMFAICASFSQYLEVLKYGAITGLFGYVTCYGLAIGPISYFLAPELVPLQNRSSMFCVCFSITSVFIVLTNFATVPLYELAGAVVFVPLFAVPTGLSMIYLYLYLPETKDKETHEIIAVLRSGVSIHRTRLNSAERHESS